MQKFGPRALSPRHTKWWTYGYNQGLIVDCMFCAVSINYLWRVSWLLHFWSYFTSKAFYIFKLYIIFASLCNEVWRNLRNQINHERTPAKRQVLKGARLRQIEAERLQLGQPKNTLQRLHSYKTYNSFMTTCLWIQY